MFIPGFGSGKNIERLTLFDSEKEKECDPIAPGESKEKYVSLTAGLYNIMAHRGKSSNPLSEEDSDAEKYGYLVVDFVTESGQRVASTRDGFVPEMVDFYIPHTLKLKIKVSREGGTDRNKIHFYITANYTH
jgi:hypothetical protein